MKKRKAYIIAAVRTPIVPMGGALKNVSLTKMAASMLNECLKRSIIPCAKVDDIFLSNALGGGGNLARLCSLSAGFPSEVLGVSIDRQCVGGLDAIIQAAQRIQQGKADLLLAGGVESFSLRPKRLYRAQWKEKPVPFERPPFYPKDNPARSLGTFIQALKKKYHISDEEEYQWAQNSHEKALRHKTDWKAEISPLTKSVFLDPYSRKLTRQLFQKANAKFGSIHPCNTAPKADGAAFVAVASENLIKKHNLVHTVEIEDGFTLGGSPKTFPLLPASAMQTLLKQNHLSWNDIEHIELMEAYAVQALLCAKLSGAPIHKINPHGGALSRGHPIGASGAVLAVHLFHSLKQQPTRGLAAIAGAGGLASVLLLKS